MSVCKYCEEDKDNLVSRQYPYQEGEYCRDCVLDLDSWSAEKWRDFYDDLAEAVVFSSTSACSDDYFSYDEKIRRQSQDRYGTCDICGKSRRDGHCSCV